MNISLVQTAEDAFSPGAISADGLYEQIQHYANMHMKQYQNT